MSATTWGVLVIFLASFTVLAIVLVGTVRQLKGFVSTMTRFQDRIQPLAERINRDGAIAQERMLDVAAAAQAISARQPGSPSVTASGGGSSRAGARDGD